MQMMLMMIKNDIKNESNDSRDERKDDWDQYNKTTIEDMCKSLHLQKKTYQDI